MTDENSRTSNRKCYVRVCPNPRPLCTPWYSNHPGCDLRLVLGVLLSWPHVGELARWCCPPNVSPTRPLPDGPCGDADLLGSPARVRLSASGRCGWPRSAKDRDTRGGRRARGAPVRNTHRMAFRTVRWSLEGRPRLGGFCRGSKGAIVSHFSSVGSPRLIRAAQSPVAKPANGAPL